MKKGSKHSEKSKRQIAKSLLNNTNAITHGRRSVQILSEHPTRCDICSLASGCPGYIAGSICSMRQELVALAEQVVSLTQDDRFYEHGVLCSFLAGIVQVNSSRLVRGVHQEEVEDLGIDPEVTRLSKTVVDQVRALARLLGYDQPDPRVFIDKRQQSVEIHIGNLNDADYQEALEAMSTLRDIDEGKLFNQIISEEESTK